MERNVLEFKNIYLDVVNKDKDRSGEYAKLLNGISFTAYSGRLTVVMGASGAGKTNLFNTIIGDVIHTSKTHGYITYNGKERTKEEWFGKIAYLEQDDVYVPKQTVRSFVTYTAQFKNPGMNKKDIDLQVDNALQNACILNKSNALIESLSGGERKRVMIANTIVSDPDIIFLDEPTTGLDSHTALLLVNYLKEIAVKRNKIVIMTVHQPGEGLFNMFDDILYLARGGSVFYSGEVSKLEDFLKEHQFEKPETLSLSEFVFELHSENPFPASIAQFRPKVDQIVQENKKREEAAFKNPVMKQYTSEYFTNGFINIHHVYLLIKRHVMSRYASKFYIVYLGVLFVLMYLFKFMFISNFNSFLEMYLNLQDDKKKNVIKELGKEFKDNFNSNESVFLENTFGYTESVIFLLLSEGLSGIPNVTKKEVFYGQYTVYSFYSAVFVYEIIKILACIIMNIFFYKIGGFKNAVTPKSIEFMYRFLLLVSLSLIFFKYFVRSSVIKYVGYFFVSLTSFNYSGYLFNFFKSVFAYFDKTGTMFKIPSFISMFLIPICPYNMLHLPLIKRSMDNVLGDVTKIRDNLTINGFKHLFYSIYSSELDPFSVFNLKILPKPEFHFSNYLVQNNIFPLTFLSLTYLTVSSILISTFLVLYGLYRRFNPTVRLKL